ncbi:NYN domain-containing protein [Candidatus Poriferisocius sp.]|uniref:NYN domain-containing protein n=1 Tax=Candidatus Poriferisocius sp. TaxID=3101276 RepID=UPI003B017EC2
MDRFAVFVDAGHLYAEGGKLCCGSWVRKDFQFNTEEFSKWLCEHAKRACGLALLRTYWYDGARDAFPTPEHQRMAALSNVKLRLGRLNTRNQQKGVDSLIYRDLTTLARERAISDAYLLSGDEDLREGVKAAQDMGVRVTLVGVSTVGDGWNQSRELVDEADEAMTLSKQDLALFIKCSPTVDKPTESSSDSAIGSRPGVEMNVRRNKSPGSGGDPMPTVQTAAARFAGEWLDGATPDDVASVLQGKPLLPADLDSALLRSLEQGAGGILYEQQYEYLRRAARGAFLLRVKQWASSRSDAEN